MDCCVLEVEVEVEVEIEISVMLLVLVHCCDSDVRVIKRSRVLVLVVFP